VILHVVLMQLEESATEHDRMTIVEGLNALPRSIPEIKSYHIGNVVDQPGSSWDVGLVAEFATLDDYRVFKTHPVHYQFATESVLPFMAKSAAGRIEVI
jgi:hypothetical protein